MDDSWDLQKGNIAKSQKNCIHVIMIGMLFIKLLKNNSKQISIGLTNHFICQCYRRYHHHRHHRLEYKEYQGNLTFLSFMFVEDFFKFFFVISQLFSVRPSWRSSFSRDVALSICPDHFWCSSQTPCSMCLFTTFPTWDINPLGRINSRSMFSTPSLLATSPISSSLVKFLSHGC